MPGWSTSRPYLDVCEATVAAEFNARVPLLQKYLCQKYIRWPTSHERTELRAFSTGTPYAGSIAIVDGTCIPIHRPRADTQEDYYNGHGKRHCICTQVTCDLLGRIIHISACVQGTRHDLTQLQVRELQWRKYDNTPLSRWTVIGTTRTVAKSSSMRVTGYWVTRGTS